ncbi:hypothetical protein LTR37_013516 [Vermiconidia calcicola]|uniref:Uncharacterized protein n=1 Tax=Vermiconidia calcicola TaxID=1690605 RepID=A0ACC3MW89_9PEZI|nr:hypothetical protein LTR37_013516 [Vermiconidia calcicola]
MALTAKQRRPSRLLNKQQTAPNKKITNKNAAESPLLRLPPEIRNRIYGYVLGGKTLHVDVSLYRLSITVCRAIQPDTLKADTIREQGAENETFHYKDHHVSLGCTLSYREDNGSRKLDVALLRACRYIHREAALLPYLLNTFAFDCDNISWQWSLFMDALNPSQRRAIRAITLVTSYRNLPHILPAGHVSKLTGLTHVTLYGHYLRSAVRMPKTNLLDRLAKLPIKRARICATQTEKPLSRPVDVDPKLLAMRMRRWTQAAEKLIERPSDKETDAAS